MLTRSIASSCLIFLFLAACKSKQEKTDADSMGVTGVAHLSRMQPAVESLLQGFLRENHRELFNPKDYVFSIGDDWQFRWSVNPFAYLTQFAGGLLGIKFGVANFSYVVNRQVFKNGGIDFQYSPVGGALGTKPCFDFDVLKVSIPQMAIEDKVWSDTNKFKNARLENKCIKQ
jgi:hypothetical protein